MPRKKFKVKYGVDIDVEENDDDSQAPLGQLFKTSLCSNCRHQGDCAFLMKASRPIFECELHECGLSEKPRLLLVRKMPESTVPEAREESSLLGLCITCENLNECNLPRPFSGVWECEEYC
jgi:hypothetical protein